MPEPPAWRFQKIIKPMFDLPAAHRILLGRVLTCVGDQVIEDGFVEIEEGQIKGIGRVSDLGDTAANVEETSGTILPGLFNNHAHLAWDGIHDLAHQAIKTCS